jgi:hypothetical protein
MANNTHLNHNLTVMCVYVCVWQFHVTVAME